MGSLEHGTFGHVYGWEISALNGDESDVTNYCDWTDITLAGIWNGPRGTLSAGNLMRHRR